jgi:hypothetical protein
VDEFDGSNDLHTRRRILDYEKLLRHYTELKSLNAPQGTMAELERLIREKKESVEEMQWGSEQGFSQARFGLNQTSTGRLCQVLRMYKEYVDEIPPDLTESEFGVWRRYLEKVIKELQEVLATRGEAVSANQAVITQATSAAKLRAEIILGLRQTAEELKQKYPNETWPEIDREIHKAIDKVRRES